MTGHVYFVGAGPGAPGLLTRDAHRAIQTAHVLLVDALVSPAVLNDIRWDATVVDVGKRGGQSGPAQEQITERLIHEARAGRKVVRLKGGDPTTFGRLSEEIEGLQKYGIPWSVVPGITAACAAAAAAGFSLTDRDLSASLTLLTGHRRVGGPNPELDWQAASRSGTVAVYMGVLQAHDNVDKLLQAGVPPETPVLIVRRASWNDEQMWQTRLADLPDAIDRYSIRPPAVWIVGDVTTNARIGVRRPNNGNVVLLRPAGQDNGWKDRLEQTGRQVLWFPLQRTIPAPDIGRRLSELAENPGDYAIFTSPNAVRYWLDAHTSAGHDVRSWSGVRIASTGEATTAALAAAGIRCDLTSHSSGGAGELATILANNQPAVATIFQAADGQSEGFTKLATAGWQLTYCRTHKKELRGDGRLLQLAASRNWINAIIWTSSSQVEGVTRLAPEMLRGQWIHIAIGDPTAQALVSAGVPEPVKATHPDLESVVNVLDQN